MDIDGWEREELGELCDILANRMVQHIQGECAAILRGKKLEALIDSERRESSEAYRELSSLSKENRHLKDEVVRLENDFKNLRASIMDELSSIIPAQVKAERDACRQIAQKHVQEVGGVNHVALTIYNEIGARK